MLSQQSTNARFFLSHRLTESSELNIKNKGPKYSSDHVLEFLRRMTSSCKHMCSGIYDVMKSYLTRVRDKKIRNGYITLETRGVI